MSSIQIGAKSLNRIGHLQSIQQHFYAQKLPSLDVAYVGSQNIWSISQSLWNTFVNKSQNYFMVIGMYIYLI